jgi:DNA polymerase-3 subunit epsilon
VGTVSIRRSLTRWRNLTRWRSVTSWRSRRKARRLAAARATATAPALRLPAFAAACSAAGELLDCGGRAIAETDFVIVDLETTGWTPGEAGITEIGAVRFSGGQVTGEFCALINPGHPIPAEIAALTGISDAMVAQAPGIAAVLPDFLAFAGSSVLTAHNAPFDLGFLMAACGDCGLSWPDFPVLDTVTLARQLLGETEVPDCKLTTLATYFGSPTAPSHRALADARATAAVLHGLIGRLTASGVRTLAEIAG